MNKRRYSVEPLEKRLCLSTWELFGIVGNHLVTIDQTTADATDIGTTPGHTPFLGLTFNAATSTSYVVGEVFDNSTLVTINLCDGHATEIGPIDLIAPTTLDLKLAGGLAHNSADGLLYGVFSENAFPPNTVADRLATVDPITGNATQIATITGTLQNELDNIVFIDGTLYGTDGNGSIEFLYTIDLSTGVATLVGQIGFARISGLAYDAQSQTIIASSNHPQLRQLIRISPSTGQGTLVGSTHTLSEFDGELTRSVAFAEPNCNQPPDAVNDIAGEVIVSEDGGPGAVDITTGVLANDNDPDGDPLTVILVDDSSITAGLLDLVSGAVTFDPNGAFESLADGDTATQTFTYTIDDGNGGQDAATVDILIIGENDDPSVAADSDPVTINEGALAANTGTFDDVDSTDNVTISASIGMITFQDTGNGGNWSWEFSSTDGPDETQLVTITASDGNGGMATTQFQLNVNNVAPTVSSITVANAPIAIDDQMGNTVDVTFSDPAGAIDNSYTCEFDMDFDGTIFNADETVTAVAYNTCSTSLN